MRWHPSLDAFFALLFAICVLVALLLLTGCTDLDRAAPAVRGTAIVPIAAAPAREIRA